MRTVLIIVLFFALAAVAQDSQPQPKTSPTAQPQSASPTPNARKARQLLNDCIQALGGNAWLNIKDYEEQGRSYGFEHGQPETMGVPYWLFWKAPDKERIELTKQRDVIYIYNGNKGYEITYKGTAARDPYELKKYIRFRDHSVGTVLRDWLKAPNVALFYDGPSLAQQKYTDQVTVMKGDDSVTLYLDRDTHLPVKTEFEWRGSDQLKNVEDEVFDAWRPEQGIMTAHSTMRMHNGETTNQRFIYSVKYNQGTPDSKFEAKITYTPPGRPDHPDD